VTLGAVIAGAAVRGGAVLLVAAGAAYTLRSAEAAARHRVWLLALAAQLVVLPLAAGLPWTLDVLPRWTGILSQVRPVTGDGDPSGTMRTRGNAWASIQQGQAGGTPIDAAPSRLESGHWPPWGGALLVAVWVLGLLVVLTPYGVAWARVARLSRSSTRFTHPAWETEARTLSRRMGIRRPVRLLRADALPVPVTWGVMRPAIALPPDAGTWSADRRRIVLLHELAHVRRLDAAWRPLAHLALALFWFDPLVWLAVRRLDTEAEHACDDVVLAHDVRPSLYVRELVRIARAVTSGQGRLRTAVALGVLPLADRARAILHPGRPRPGSRRGPGRFAVAAVAFAVLPVVAVRPAPAPTQWNPATVAANANGAPRSAAATGCVHDGGRHVNRQFVRADGVAVWEVAWSGVDCEVRFRAVGPAALATDGFAIAAIEPGGSVVVDVRSRRGPIGLVIEPTLGGRISYRSGQSRRPVDAETATAWFGRFLAELDQHTGFAAAWRVPSLLTRGGVDTVLAEAAGMQGDHAAGAYFRELLHLASLNDDDVRRVAWLAGRTVANDAILTGVLLDLAGRYDIAGARAVPDYRAAAATLEARAAREAALSALRPIDGSRGQPPAGSR
jgi:beta-lactamase regulating signal transducer with metallopeptidase domain